jgi:hypothetical protein
METGNPSGNVTRLKNSYSVAKITQSGQTGASYAVAAAYFEHVRHPIRNGITAHARNQRGGTTPLLLLLDSYRWILGGETPVRRRAAIRLRPWRTKPSRAPKPASAEMPKARNDDSLRR